MIQSLPLSGAGTSTAVEITGANTTDGCLSPTGTSHSPADTSPTKSESVSTPQIPAPAKATAQEEKAESQKPQKPQMWNEVIWQAATNAKADGAPVSFSEVILNGEWQIVYVFRNARICRACKYPYLGDKCERDHAAKP